MAPGKSCLLANTRSVAPANLYKIETYENVLTLIN